MGEKQVTRRPCERAQTCRSSPNRLNAEGYLLSELHLHLDLVGHGFPGLPAVFFPVILLEPLLVLNLQQPSKGKNPSTL